MLTINIRNDQTGTDESANYTFDVLVNGRKIDGGVITGHNRKDDWKTLVAHLLRQNGDFDVIPIIRMTQEEWDALHDKTFFEIMEGEK